MNYQQIKRILWESREGIIAGGLIGVASVYIYQNFLGGSTAFAMMAASPIDAVVQYADVSNQPMVKLMIIMGMFGILIGGYIDYYLTRRGK